MKGIWKYLEKINYILDKRQKRNLAILAVFIAIGSAFEMLSISAVLPVVNVITNPDVINSNKWYKALGDFLNIHEARQYIFVLSLILIFMYIVKNLFLILLYKLQYRYINNNQKRISYKLMQCYLSQDYLFHVSHNVAELQRNCGTDVFNFFQVLLNVIQLATELMTICFLVVFLLLQDVTTTLFVIFLMLIFLYFVLFVFKKTLISIGMKLHEINAEMNKWFLQSFQGIKEIKVSNREQYFLNHYDYHYSKSVILTEKSMLISIIPRPIMEMVVVCGLLLYVAIRILTGVNLATFVPTLAVFVVAAYRILPSFNRISGCFSVITSAKTSVDKIYQDLHDIEGLRMEVERDNQDTTELSLKDGIIFKDVTFYYPSRPEAIVLDNINMVIPQNKSVAIIGPSGSGKTTLADVVLGVLKPESGHVIVDGVDIFDHLHSWHKHVGYIPQNIYLMDDTIRANVAFGFSKEDTDDDRVWKVLEEAQLADYFREKDMGLDDNIGAMGVKLSGGQRQRIGIARALYNEPEILVLDEATSALDTETETAVMESIDNLSGTKTMVIIAHRLTTIRNCDIVYEVRGGKVKERDKKEVMDEAYGSMSKAGD